MPDFGPWRCLDLESLTTAAGRKNCGRAEKTLLLSVWPVRRLQRQTAFTVSAIVRITNQYQIYARKPLTAGSDEATVAS